MKRKRTTRKCDAIYKSRDTFDYRPWLGLALRAPLNPKPRFRNEDELWR
jgi:hypothetical protein